ncbi:hypothetical protein [Marinospirillum sp.]|uniref:hypothetical protein n=1 Tax=Marinospirillum sp. TaxID=2183934 RepID=UPI0025BBC001|nr:hypothetical protein [Marinospirillum sp.]
MTIDPFVVMFDYRDMWLELKAWLDALKDINLLYQININIRIPCPGEPGFEETMADLAVIGNQIPSSWMTVETVTPDFNHPILSGGVSGSAGGGPLDLLTAPEQLMREGGRALDWLGSLEAAYGDGAVGVGAMGANPLWLTGNEATQVNELVFDFPKGLHQEPGFGWVPGDQVVIKMTLDAPTVYERDAELNESLQKTYTLEQTKSIAENKALEYRIFLAGKTEQQLLSLLSRAQAGDDAALREVEDTYHSTSYAHQQIINGQRYEQVDAAIDREILIMARQHLRGLVNINDLWYIQQASRQQSKLQRLTESSIEELYYDPNMDQMAGFFAGNSSEQDIDLLRHGYPLLTVLRHDLIFLRDNPHLKTGEFLMNGMGQPHEAVRIANILLGRTLDLPQVVNLHPDAPEELQVKGWNAVIMNNVLRDGLTRMVMARPYLVTMERKSLEASVDRIDDTAIADLHLMRVRAELEQHSLRQHLLESQLRREQLLGIYMTLDLQGDVAPYLDFDPDNWQP